MATNKKDGTSQPSRSRKAASKTASRSGATSGTVAPKRAQPKALASALGCDEVPGCSHEGPFLHRIAHGRPLDLRHGEITVHNAGPLRIPLAGQSAEPDGLAVDP
jgi:hypothetical protein